MEKNPLATPPRVAVIDHTLSKTSNETSRWAHRCAFTFTINKNKAANLSEMIAALFSVIVQQCPNT
eukprot:11460819-Ditylum_brightwellii.AAC.1